MVACPAWVRPGAEIVNRQGGVDYVSAFTMSAHEGLIRVVVGRHETVYTGEAFLKTWASTLNPFPPITAYTHLLDD